ncbi:MAG: hypothetical protein CMO82_08480 [Winogradskyella sp.]|uniref:Anti-sigma factor n=1 Tax=Winogradskyella poriferorum TaxID=307627 RepID=A0ABU7W9T3_9FLAO|nr:hypothetical protein [Winogradskyella sp.]|tara:strand:- start:1927 stop:2493 length:567 start_codon:yes stop_codon:yes gene_type:complete
MAQDLRNLFEKDRLTQRAKMSQDHEARFLDKLDKELPIENKSSGFSFLNIAASVVVLLGLSFGAYKYFQTPIDVESKQEIVDTDLKTLGDVSPDLKKVEDYYLASINLELSKVELTPQNKELFDGYVLRLQELNKEYDKLLEELNENGPNSVTLDALIENLKLRLNLVMRLKDKLEEFNDDAFEQEIT